MSHLQEDGISELLLAPAKLGIPGISGTRRLSDNLSDLKAQVAANAKGIALVQSLISESSLAKVQLYMGYIQANAEAAVRQMLQEFSIAQVSISNLAVHLWLDLNLDPHAARPEQSTHLPI
jgi:5-oxoprolinase (ATP-hydrolysing)